MKIKTYNIGKEYTDFLAKYENVISKINGIQSCTINLIECSSADFMKTLNNPFCSTFEDVGSPMLMIDGKPIGKNNEFSVYRISDCCECLNEEDNYALLLHELGHIEYIINDNKTLNDYEQELYADNFAATYIGKNAVKHALDSLLQLDISSKIKDEIKNRIELL